MLLFNSKNYVIIISFIAVGIISGCATQASYLKLDSSLNKEMRTFEGAEYLPLTRICEVYNLKCSWDSFARTAEIEKKNKRIILRAGSRSILVDGIAKNTEKPVLFTDGTVFVPTSFVRDNLGAMIAEMPQPGRAAIGIGKKFAIKTVVIDAGHGGKDRGATGKRLRLREKDLTLAISKRLKDTLEKQGLRVLLTRSGDTFVSLQRRVEIANESKADLFISVHVNASRSRSLSGFECYYLSEATDDNARALEASEKASLQLGQGTILGHSRNLDKTLWDITLTENRRESAELAFRICASMEDDFLMRNRGIRSARFYVLKGVRIPAILVEAGYISNRYEEMKLKDSLFIDRIVNSLAKGIMAYKDEYERTEGFTE